MTSGDDAVQLRSALERALDGGPALGLGMPGEPPQRVEEGTAVVIGTSGSTGVPKRVVLSATALRASALATTARLGAGHWVLALPAGYVAGLQVLVRSIVAKTTPVLLDGGFSPRAFAAATVEILRDPNSPARSGPLFTSFVPAQLQSLVDAADQPIVGAALRAYDAILIGGQALPEQVSDRALELGAKLVRTYGSTETSGGCVYNGVPFETVAARTVNGELQLSGPVLADGYLGDPELTNAAFIRDEQGVRWYRTGDLGSIEAGVVQVHGRVDNVIVSGGINISLDQVERIVRGIPGLGEAVVVGVDDKRWGEASVIVAPRGGALRHTRAEQLERAREAVAHELGKHARPSRLLFVDELATLPSGKPDRAAIRRMVATLR